MTFLLDKELLGDIPVPPLEKFSGRERLIPATPTSVSSVLTCPKQYQHKYGIDGAKRTPFVPSPATEFGNAVHTAAENYLQYEAPVSKAVSTKIPHLPDLLAAYRQLPGFNTQGVEQSLQINALGACNWGNHAIGVKSDLLLRPKPTQLVYTDWKTNGTHTSSGKEKPPKMDEVQAQMTAVCAFISDPKLELVIARYEMLMHGVSIRAIFDRNKPDYTVILPDGTSYQKDYDIVGSLHIYWRVQQDKMFNPKPSGLCKAWCDVMECSHNGKVKNG